MDPLSLYLTVQSFAPSQPTQGTTMSGIVTIFLLLAAFGWVANVVVRTIGSVRRMERLSKPVKVIKHIDNKGNIIIAVQQGRDSIHMEEITLNRSHVYSIATKKGINLGGGQTRTETKVVYKNTGDFWKVFLDLEGTNNVTQAVVMQNYKKLAMEYHPDKPSGSQELMKKLNRAKDEALKVIK